MLTFQEFLPSTSLLFFLPSLDHLIITIEDFSNKCLWFFSQHSDFESVHFFYFYHIEPKSLDKKMKITSRYELWALSSIKMVSTSFGQLIDIIYRSTNFDFESLPFLLHIDCEFSTKLALTMFFFVLKLNIILKLDFNVFK